MTPQQCDVIVESFALVLKDRTSFGLVFYRRLFAIAPELRPMFRVDIPSQAKKLVDLLATGVSSLHKVESLTSTLKSLGARHVAYGVTSDQYVYVGIALLGTLEECLGVAFDAHAREAWTALYTFVSQTMKAGAAEYRLAPARRAG